jgi:Domain of unknown function (DUF5615)
LHLSSQLMLRLLIDQNFDHDILRGIERRIPSLDYVTAAEMGLTESPDPELLEWAAAERRVILTHDQSTMPDHVAERLSNGQEVFGVIIAPQELPIRVAINELELIIECSSEDEYLNRYLFLPL